MTSRSQALRFILDHVAALDCLDRPLERCLGLATAADIFASEHLPPFDRSAMDGFAVRSQDCVDATDEHPITLKVTGVIHPSTDRLPSVQPGETVRIMTGGAMPPGADAVLPQEWVTVGEDRITVGKAVSPQQYVSKKGKDMARGDVVAEQGTIIDPVIFSMMAAQRIKAVSVHPKPTVRILAIGNELQGYWEKESGHKIVASNLYLLSTLMESMGATVVDARISENSEKAIVSDFRRGFRSDLVITTGGTGKGPADVTRKALEAAGVDFRWTGLAMAPGKGTMFGVYGRKPVFALPGTPAAVLVISHVFIRPALKKLMGCAALTETPLTAILERDVRKKAGLERLVPGWVEEKKGHLHVRPIVGEECKGFTAMAEANGLIIIPPRCDQVNEGASVLVQRFETPTFCTPSGVGVRGKKPRHTPCISIVGKSGMGKTTLLEKLIPEFCGRGYRVGTIKHNAHGFDIDHKEKDSWRHKHAGAHTVVIASSSKVAVVRDILEEQPLQDVIEQYFQDVDIVFTEGYKKEQVSKVEVFRRHDQGQPICKEDPNLVALYTDTVFDLGVPCFHMGDVKGLADFLTGAVLGPLRT